MKLKESDITRRCISLVGFRGESRNTIRETVLLVYAEGVNMYTKVLILDNLSTYNVIFGSTLDPSDGSCTVYLPSNSSIPNQMGNQGNIWTTIWIMTMLSNYTQAKNLHSRVIATTRRFPGQTLSGGTKNGGNQRSFHLSRFPKTQSPNWRLAQQHFERSTSILFEWKPWLLCMITQRYDRNWAVHRLQVDPDYPPFKQKRRKFATERNIIINEEIYKLIDIGVHTRSSIFIVAHQCGCRTEEK